MADPLSRLPWDIAQDQFGVQGADFIGVLGRLLLRTVQDQIRAYLIDHTVVVGTHARGETQDQIGFGP